MEGHHPRRKEDHDPHPGSPHSARARQEAWSGALAGASAPHAPQSGGRGRISGMKGQQKPKKGQKKAPQKSLKEKRADKRASDKTTRGI